MNELIDADELEIYRSALRIADNMLSWSRTAKAGRLRFLAVMHVILGELDVDTIARRMKVSRRRVFQALREVRAHCEPL